MRCSLELGDYCEFYSHLAMQARRASRVALLACSVALVAMISAILAQLKPPILLRVQDGKVTSLNGSGVEAAQTAAQQQPDEAEKLSFVSGFLDRFVNIDPVTVKRDTTMALNQMTNTLRQHILSQLNEQHFVDTVRDNNVTATLAVKSSSARACTIRCPKPEGGSSRSSNATSTTTRYQDHESGSVSGSGARALVAYSSPPEPETPDLVDAYPCIGSALASSTEHASSLSGRSLRRYTSEIRTGCANERPSGSVRGVPREWYPYRDQQLTNPSVRRCQKPTSLFSGF
jgi:hypothetical protein